MLSMLVLSMALAGPAPATTTTAFAGVKVNRGTASYREEGGKRMLTLSKDFVVPDAPAPHWQVVDSKGRTYLLERLVIKGDVFHSSVTVPDYVPDLAKVQIWCAFAEVLLGEAVFPSVVGKAQVTRSTGMFAGVKVQRGKVQYTRLGERRTLTLSDDFVVPDAPAPHWQVVDSAGHVYLLQRLAVKDGKVHKTIELPAYVPDVVKVQVWCAWAEALLGEADFAQAAM